MEIREFLELSAGNWFCQRTSYLLNPEKAENSKSEITITLLEQQHPDLIKLSQEHNIESSATVGGMRTDWDNSVDWGKPKEKGFSLVIAIPDLEQPQQGRLLQTTNIDNQQTLFGSYIIGRDDALTFTVETKGMKIIERLWFASPNFRLRTSLIESTEGWLKTSFYSEIRKVAPPS